MRQRRITIVTGHYGSGKSNIALNLALRFRAEGKRTFLADMDIVNPYFRTADSRALLEEHGVKLICSGFAGGNLDVPALPKELYGITEDPSCCAVLDVGGDDRGAVALGRFAPAISRENDYEMLFVVNFYRPLTKTPEDALAVLREIEAASKLTCTALVNNSNLGVETTANTVLDSAERMDRLSQVTGLPILFTSAAGAAHTELTGKIPDLINITLQQTGAALWREEHGKDYV